MRRLQQLDMEETPTESLTSDLHGEPLVLARRLESAFDRLAHISKTDQLTGLANRRHFEQVLDCFYVQARRYNRPLSLIVMDIDFFKAINDTGGHQAGDELLKVVSAAIEKACRKADLPARIGGDEFAVLLPETNCADGVAVAERIRSEVCAEPANIRGMEINVTLSVGIADLNAAEIDRADAMISLADKALYAAKEQGRNRVVSAHDLSLAQGHQPGEEAGKVNVLCRKLAGLDTRFKDLFIRAIQEIMEILEHRDPHMADHARKVQRFSLLIGQEMELPDRVLKRIQIAAMLHDIGMVAMPDSILLCPGKLNEADLRLMRRHPLLSVRVMEGMEFLEQEIPAVRYHHERYDGKGYPEGLSGAAIPLTARILAVADAFDAMTSPRTFRAAMGRTEALNELRRHAGSQFDPVIVDAFTSAALRLGDKLTDLEHPIEGLTELGEACSEPREMRQLPSENEAAVSNDVS
jgi:diguanylate cyclase (GGDEF)-like protein